MVRIDIQNTQDVRAWCKTLSCSPVDLIEAVNAMGPVAEDVHLFLRHRLPQVLDFIDPAVLPWEAAR